MPTRNLKLNKYGNISGGQGPIQKLLNRKNTFQGTVGGVSGICQRPDQGKLKRRGYGMTGKTGLKLLVAYEPTAQYQPRFDFYGIAERIVPVIVGKAMDRAIARAFASKK